MEAPLLSVHGLTVDFNTDAGNFRAVDGLTFDIPRGKTVALVGESGSGKSVTAQAILQILSKKAKITGGSIVFIASKNGLAASPNAAAYCTAKAAEIHLARCLALEGAEFGIRVNTVNPDAVLRGSKIWTGEWRQQRADAYNMKPDELEEHYRKRSMLKLSVYPEDVAEAVYFFVSGMAAKSTGNIVNVDAGNAQAFTR